MNSNLLPKKLVILALVLPIAAFIGFRLADPDYGSLSMIAVLAAALCVPILLKWHHPLLIFCWNMPMMVFFLPGTPHLWMLASFGSLAISFLGTILDKDRKMIRVPVMDLAMISLVVVVLFTMKATGGGFGLRVLGGSTYGAKKYFTILFAVVGYYALSCQRFPLQSANKYLAMLILPGAATAFSNLIYMLGPSLWFLYALFPVDYAIGQAIDDFSLNATSLKIGRIGGLAVVGLVFFSFILARYGVRGVLDITKPWRLGLLVIAGILGLLGGFRSNLVNYAGLFTIQFFLEGLHKTRLMPVVLGTAVLGFVLLLPVVDKLPLPIQRCFSLLPVEVHPAVKAETLGSNEWRVNMWKVLLPEIPKYLWVGKGFTASASDYYLTQQAMRFGFLNDFEGSLLAGDYHNGPLSVIIPFGIWGAMAFLLLVGASFHVLFQNYRYGDSSVRHINTFLFATLISRSLFFFFIFGAVQLEIQAIIGLVGFSISLNGGVCRQRVNEPVVAKKASPSPVRIRPGPAMAR